METDQYTTGPTERQLTVWRDQVEKSMQWTRSGPHDILGESLVVRTRTNSNTVQNNHLPNNSF